MSDELNMFSVPKPKTPYTGEDKREAQHKREAIKTTILLFLGILLGIAILLYGIEYATEKAKPNTELAIAPIQDTVVNDISGLIIVHKVSKDYRKYFMSYKQYIDNKSYMFKIQQITFDQFLLIEKGDTLTTEEINNIQTIQKQRNDTNISNNN